MAEQKYRVGIGYDIHKLVEGRKLILGGIEIPYEKGLLGHSDADVLIHAIIDALLGALALDDIGTLFPDTDQNIKMLIVLFYWKMFVK
jgi:2-C-methyl-D-erythritol 2,4-cyclodiphosphate synthase